ncbi:MarR family winged helix-turn-helix transcriptional regulator [Pseudoduganella armeniaca]|uniref:MarR family transcriptional regulator n=1 Tax=Pseudoduganella armeniaca TaxID=2072590 RepID=A0A2R4CAZ4_9BURK|nr:MarR family transcriptional regulator [Pseudoduganella armeniaca]AVR96732.1 MarR family transcriptional regulator [Pseudoduganella armeniaca]
MNRHTPEDVARLAEDLRGAVGRFVRSVRSATHTATTAQGEVMAQLARDGPATVAALAQQRGVKHQSMRLVVARLVEQGTVALLDNPRDGRSQLVTLTEQGLAQVQAERSMRTDYLAQTLASRLSGEERRLLGQAIALLDRVSAAADEAPHASASP